MPTPSMPKEIIDLDLFKANVALQKLLEQYNKHVELFREGHKTEEMILTIKNDNTTFDDATIDIINQCKGIVEQHNKNLREYGYNKNLESRANHFWNNLDDHSCNALVVGACGFAAAGVVALIPWAITLPPMMPLVVIVTPVIILSLGIIALAIGIIETALNQRQAKKELAVIFPQPTRSADMSFTLFNQRDQQIKEQIKNIKVPADENVAHGPSFGG